MALYCAFVRSDLAHQMALLLQILVVLSSGYTSYYQLLGGKETVQEKEGPSGPMPIRMDRTALDRGGNP